MAATSESTRRVWGTPCKRKVVRRTDRGTLVTDGPYAESAEQVGGFYLVESHDLDDLLAVVGELARTEPVVEVRPIHGRTSGVPS